MTRPAPVDASAGASITLRVPVRGDVVVADRDALIAPVPDADLELRFRAARARDPETRVIIIAEPEVTTDRVFALFDQAKQLGLSRFSLGVDPSRTHALDSPRAASGEMELRATLGIRIPGTEDVVINGEAVPDAGLDARLVSAAAADPRPSVMIVADGVVSTGRAVGIMDRVKRAGFTALAIGRVVP